MERLKTITDNMGYKLLYIEEQLTKIRKVYTVEYEDKLEFLRNEPDNLTKRYYETLSNLENINKSNSEKNIIIQKYGIDIDLYYFVSKSELKNKLDDDIKSIELELDRFMNYHKDKETEKIFKIEEAKLLSKRDELTKDLKVLKSIMNDKEIERGEDVSNFLKLL